MANEPQNQGANDIPDGDGHWDSEEEELHIHNLFKWHGPSFVSSVTETLHYAQAKSLLEDCTYRFNMYMLSAQHYRSLNMAVFTVPSIIITSLASFLSFAGATDPRHSKKSALVVGFLGTIATILTALQSAYKYDTQAETFRVTAAEYLLLVTRIASVMRKDKVWPGEWERLWRTIETTMVELQKKTTSHPNRQLVEEWGRQGLLEVSATSGAALPPWLMRYQKILNEDGIQDEDDLRFVSDEMLDKWSRENFIIRHEENGTLTAIHDPEKGHSSKYPQVTITKMKAERDKLIAARQPKRTVHLKFNVKPATAAALRKRGIMDLGDLRLASDGVLDGVIQELIQNDSPPMPLAWIKIEENRAEILRYGSPCPGFREWCPVSVSPAAKARIERVVNKNYELTVSGRLRAEDGKLYGKDGKVISA